MTTKAPTLDPVLLRQLKKVGLTEPAALPSPEVWGKLLTAINDYYRHMNDDRALLARSIEISTTEMDGLRRSVEGQRDQLSSVLDAIADALGLFGGVVAHDVASGDMTGVLQHAKAEFSARLQNVLGDDRERDSSQISGVYANLVRLADQLIHLLSEMAEKAAIKKELEVARAVQSLLVPSSDVIERSFVRLVGHFQPASECGGDWWAVYDLPDDKVLTLIGDVTGHGISSAIITGAAKAACDLARHVTGGRLGPGELLGMMNHALYETSRQEVMMTCCATVFDPRAKRVSVANAGHHFPVHVHRGLIRSVIAQGAPLGASDQSAYDEVHAPFEPGDTVLWYTDGVIECENDVGEQFSERRLRAVFQRALAGGAVATRQAIVDAVEQFRRGRAQDDDMTFVVASLH